MSENNIYYDVEPGTLVLCSVCQLPMMYPVHPSGKCGHIVCLSCVCDSCPICQNSIRIRGPSEVFLNLLYKNTRYKYSKTCPCCKQLYAHLRYQDLIRHILYCNNNNNNNNNKKY